MTEPDGPQTLKRSRFFSGQLLTPEDFEREQQYVREKLKRHNRTLHGFGIVSGLQVKIDSGQIVVGPGLALDCEGNELLIETPQTVAAPIVLSSSATLSSNASSSGASLKALPSSASSPVDLQTVYLNVRFVEECAGPAPAIATPEIESASSAAVYRAESFALEVSRENCNRGHRHLRARWLACGQPHPLTIAKLRRKSHGWTVDRGYRPPSVK